MKLRDIQKYPGDGPAKSISSGSYREYLARSERAGMALEVYEAVIATDVSLYSKTGGDLAYLMACIIKGERKISILRRSHLRQILTAAFPSSEHAVWRHVEVT